VILRGNANRLAEQTDCNGGTRTKFSQRTIEGATWLVRNDNYSNITSAFGSLVAQPLSRGILASENEMDTQTAAGWLHSCRLASSGVHKPGKHRRANIYRSSRKTSPTPYFNKKMRIFKSQNIHIIVYLPLFKTNFNKIPLGR